MTEKQKYAIEVLKDIKGHYQLQAHGFQMSLDMAIQALEQKPRKGEWSRMSDLSEKEDDRYECSRCGNVVHYKDKMDLYTFNSWCGRCGSDNGRKMEVVECEDAISRQGEKNISKGFEDFMIKVLREQKQAESESAE